MAQDLRKLLEQESAVPLEKMPKDHQKRFQKRLEQAFPSERASSGYLFLKIAAVLVIVLGMGAFFFYQGNISNPSGIVSAPGEEERAEAAPKNEQEQLSLRDVSPEFKKIEVYYLANLHLGISRINITKENKALIDAFMAQLAELDKEYSRLNKEFSDNGPNQETLEALLQNLQLRLDLLLKVKNKLDELKVKENEKYSNNQA